MAEFGPVPAADLVDVIGALLVAAGVAANDAHIVASHVVDAEARGNRSQGLLRVPPYVAWARSGEITSPTTITIERDAGATIVLDAHNGWGHVAAADAMERCIDHAGTRGVCLATVRNTNHIGRLGAYVETAAEHGMIGLIACSGNPASSWVAAWGGIDPIFGTNPIAIGFPRRDGPPVVVDVSTTQGARGAVLLAQKAGDLLPDGWAFDRTGHPTHDPHRALPPHGTLAPLGGHKGYALAVAIEILCGALAGLWPPATSANLVGAIQIDAFLPLDTYYQGVSALAHEMKSGSVRPGVDEIRLPGEGSAARKRQSLAQGLRVPVELWGEIVALTRALRVRHPLADAWTPAAEGPGG